MGIARSADSLGSALPSFSVRSLTSSCKPANFSACASVFASSSCSRALTSSCDSMRVLIC